MGLRWADSADVVVDAGAVAVAVVLSVACRAAVADTWRRAREHVAEVDGTAASRPMTRQ